MTHPDGPHGAFGYPPGPPPLVCARHPDRPTGVACVRCGRPACPECLREAAVGYQCVDCVHPPRRLRRLPSPGVHPPRRLRRLPSPGVAQGVREQRGARRAVTVAGAPLGVRPLVTPLLVAVNVAVYALTVLQSGSIASNSAAPLFRAWALVPGLVAEDWWRPITSGFLHFGPLHLVFNMLALWVIGRDVEVALGRGRFLALYLVSLLGGSAAAMLFYPAGAFVAGASGAVFGLMGGLAVVLRRVRFPVGQVVGLIVVNIVISVVIPGISLAGHAGGLVVGALATAALVYAPARYRTAAQAAALTALTLVLLGVIAVSGGLVAA